MRNRQEDGRGEEGIRASICASESAHQCLPATFHNAPAFHLSFRTISHCPYRYLMQDWVTRVKSMTPRKPTNASPGTGAPTLIIKEHKSGSLGKRPGAGQWGQTEEIFPKEMCRASQSTELENLGKVSLCSIPFNPPIPHCSYFYTSPVNAGPFMQSLPMADPFSPP